MKLLKPLKITSFAVTVISCAYGLNIACAYLSKELELYKRKLVASVIETDLRGKDLTIDIKDKKAKAGDKLTVDDMRKALWVLNVQNEQLRYSLESVKSALDYQGGE